MPDYDIIVIGGGHAGIEAAAATARMGLSTALVTSYAKQVWKKSLNTVD